MKVAIAGGGSVGTAIARELYANGHEVIVFEQDPELVERLRGTLDIEWIAADACAVSSLQGAGMAAVDVVVREDRLVVPKGDTVLLSGDEVLVLVTADAEGAVHALFIGA